MSIAEQIVDFYKIVEKLCIVKRDNLLSNSDSETDSDHTFKLAFLIVMTAPYIKHKADYTRMLEMALVHDVVEAKTGDIPLSQQTEEIIKQKKQKEEEAIQYYKSILPPPLNQKVYDLFMEYEERKTLEAKIVYLLDKLDAALQMNLHQDGNLEYVTELENGRWYFDYAMTKREIVKELGEPVLAELEDIIIDITKKNVAKLNATAAE